MLALNGKDLANNYLERKGLPIDWIGISPVHGLDKRLQQCQTAGVWWGSGTKSTGNHLFNIGTERWSSQPYDW